MLKTAQETGELHPSCSGKKSQHKAAQHLWKKEKEKKRQNEPTTSDSKLYRFLAMLQITFAESLKNKTNKKNKTEQTKIKDFQTSRFQVWTGLSTCWSRRNKAHLTGYTVGH